MFRQYPVDHKGKNVGHLNIDEEGLYYRYSGHFHLKEDGVFRVFGLMPSTRINLGVCTPLEGQWHIHGKIPRKKLNLNVVRFIVNSTNNCGQFIALNEKDPFEHLERLALCRFTLNGDCSGLIITEID